MSFGHKAASDTGHSQFGITHLLQSLEDGCKGVEMDKKTVKKQTKGFVEGGCQMC